MLVTPSRNLSFVSPEITIPARYTSSVLNVYFGVKLTVFSKYAFLLVACESLNASVPAISPRFVNVYEVLLSSSNEKPLSLVLLIAHSFLSTSELYALLLSS